MAYVLDLLLVLIVVLCVWRGFKRGLVHTAVVLVGIVLAALVADALAPPIADWGYETAVAPRIENAIVEKITAAGDLETQVDITSLLGNNEALGQYLTAHNIPTSLTVGLPDLSEQSVRAAIAPAMETTVRPAVTLLLTAILKVVLLLVLVIVVLLLARLVDGVFKMPLLKQLNQAGGLVLGLLQGVFWALVFAAAVQLALHYGWFGLTAHAVEDTVLLSRFSDWNWIF